MLLRLQRTAFFVCFSLGVVACSGGNSREVLQISAEKTQSYINNFDPDSIYDRGSDSLSDYYSSERVPYGESHHSYYNQNLLNTAVEKLKYVDRIAALQHIFNHIKEGTTSDLETHLRVQDFVSHVFVHYLQPQNSSGTLVFDPLILLELGEGRCGQFARFVSDLYEANGYEARIVQLGGHIIVEVFWGDGWHYMDPDIFSHRNSALISGTIPSVNELAQNPELIDQLPSYLEISPVYSGFARMAPYPSYFYFSSTAYSGYEPAYYLKNADLVPQSFDIDYNWRFYDYQSNSNLSLSAIPLRYTPTSPVIVQVTNLGGGSYNIQWDPSFDNDGDFAHYRVYLSSQARGWNYPTEFHPETALYNTIYTDRRSAYTKLTEVPGSDLGYYEIGTNSIIVNIVQETFISIQSVDYYGISVGRTVYFPSQEIKLEP